MIIQLKDGRHLAYNEYGDPSGTPLFFFHGTPGSRNCIKDDPMIAHSRIRLILPDRPGMGLSDPHPARSFASWAEDVCETADALSIGKFHVAGGSGGGPHALACATYAPGRVISSTLISSAAPPDLPGLRKGMSRGNATGFFLAKYAPFVLHWAFSDYKKLVDKRPQVLVEATLKELCPRDREVLADFEDTDMFIEELREAFSQGSQGVCRDFLLVARPWNFDYTKIMAPVFIWHGLADTLMPCDPAKVLASMIPGCEAHFIDGAGHLMMEDEDLCRRILERIRSAG